MPLGLLKYLKYAIPDYKSLFDFIFIIFKYVYMFVYLCVDMFTWV